jgi:hypothetical protein
MIVTGPKGIEARFVKAAEALYPNSTTAKGFKFTFVEYEEQKPLEVGGITVTPFEVKHPSGAPPYALRFSIDGKVVAFTGDTGWIDTLTRLRTARALHQRVLSIRCDPSHSSRLQDH